MRARFIAVCSLLAALPSASHAQDANNLLPRDAPHVQAACSTRLSSTDFVGPSHDIARMLDVLGPRSARSFMIRRTSDVFQYDACADAGAIDGMAADLSVTAPPSHGVALLPVDMRVTGNSGYPRDWNDGAQWGGAGFSTTLTTGALFRWGALEAALAPALTAHQNASFTTLDYPDPEYSRFIDRWRGRFIDLPQRLGEDDDATIGLGQSFVRVHGAGMRAGVSTGNIAWGPARRNPLLLSGTSAGFPHAFVETDGARDIWIGDAELQLLLGRLSESDYFDHVSANDHRALSGIILTLRPRGLDGLYVGAARLHAQTWDDGASIGDVLSGAWTGVDPDSSGLPRDMQLFSLFARWASAPGGFEVYGEWVRQDTWKEWLRLLNPVEALQAYTIGLQKTVRHGSNAVRFSAEFSHLSDQLAHADLGRWQQTLYASAAVVQGHTHRGQLLGAPIGPGSESQYLGADLFWNYGRSSLSIERVRYDDDAYYAVWGTIHGPHGHDTELSLRGGHLIAQPAYSIELDVGYSFRYSRDFIGLHHVNSPDFPYVRDTNYSLRLTGRWVPPSVSWER